MTQRDPGLQTERTHLSWRRTGWSMILPGLLCLRGWSHGGDIIYAFSGGLFLLGAVALFCSIGRGRHYLVSFLVIICGSLLLLATIINHQKLLL
jgi:hypothetical protein